MYERVVNFKDAAGTIFTVEIKIEDGRLSMTGEHGRGCGQCQDNIVPKDDDQEELVKIWNKWHLNDMHAGTQLQENAVKAWLKETRERYEYQHIVKYLKSIGLHTDHTKVPGYKYGTAWLKQDLPENVDIDIDKLCDRIEETEGNEVKGCFLPLLNDKELELVCDDYGEQKVALGIHLSLTDDELEEVEENGNCLSYGGREYFVGTYDEAEYEAREYLTNDTEIWRMMIADGRTELGLDDWVEMVINIDGIGHILGSYDGTEYEITMYRETYVIVRR